MSQNTILPTKTERYTRSRTNLCHTGHPHHKAQGRLYLPGPLLPASSIIEIRRREVHSCCKTSCFQIHPCAFGQNPSRITISGLPNRAGRLAQSVPILLPHSCRLHKICRGRGLRQARRLWDILRSFIRYRTVIRAQVNR